MITHNDCKHYLPADVFKGFCKRDGTKILCDDPNCDGFEYVPKCKFCENFIPKEEFLGMCKNEFEAYPDMIAKTCKNYQSNIQTK